MLHERIEKLRQEYADKQVVVDGDRPELARFTARIGQVKTINFNGRALVEFDGDDRGWYDLELDYLKVVDQPEPKPAPKEGRPVPQAAKADSAVERESKERLSALEIARLEKQAAEAARKADPSGDPTAGA